MGNERSEREREREGERESTEVIQFSSIQFPVFHSLRFILKLG